MAKLSTSAGKLPQPHKFAYAKSGNLKNKKRINATDLSMNEFMAYRLKTSACLARLPKPSIEYLNYLEFLFSMRININDMAVLSYD